LALGKFTLEIQEHLGARDIHRRRGRKITNDETQRFATSVNTIERDSENVVDVEVENRGLDAESEYARDLLVVPVACEIRIGASTRDPVQESDVGPRRVMQDQQDRHNSGQDKPRKRSSVKSLWKGRTILCRIIETLWTLSMLTCAGWLGSLARHLTSHQSL
jgi:hypothetical protein